MTTTTDPITDTAGAGAALGDAAELVAVAVRSAALAHVATLGPRLVALVVKASEDVPVRPTEGGDAQPLIDRLAAGGPLTPLADPADRDHLGDWGAMPSSVGDVMAVRGTDGRRVGRELERQCALEAAVLAPRLADALASAHPGLAAARAAALAPALTGEGGPLDPAAVLCSEVAALLVVEMLAAVDEQLADVPVSPPPPSL